MREMWTKKFLAALTRCRDEFFIKEWVDYYLSQGVDSIYIIDDNSEDKSIYDFADSREYKNVNIIYEKQYFKDTTTQQQCELDKNSPSNKLFQSSIKGKYEWLVYCDVDEFIVTKKHFHLTLRERLQQLNTNIKWICVPWVFMAGDSEKNPKSILGEVLYRMDHDKEHPYKVKKFRCRYYKIECKSIIKADYFSYIRDHGPAGEKHLFSRINGVDLTETRLDTGRFCNLRNHDIESGEFLCYHYRYISDEHAKNKLKTNGWYINDGYTFEDLKSSAYLEIYDDTFVRKANNDQL